MSDPNKALVRRFLEEVVNRGNTTLLADLVTVDHVRHAPDGDLYGLEGIRIDVAGWRTGFPDLRLVVEDLIAEGERVAYRYRLYGTHAGPFLALPATGRPVAVSVLGVDRVVGGRLAESWVCFDAIGLLRQLGAL